MKKKNTIYLMPQYSKNIGYGHLKRCQLLYNLLKKNFNPKILLIKSKLKIKEKNQLFVSQQDLIQYIKKNPPLFIIIDHRYYKNDVIKKLSAITSLVLIDSPRTYKTSSGIIHLNPATPLKYSNLSENTYIYEGIKYLPLKQGIIKYSRKKQKTKSSIFISFGNSDPNQLSLKILKLMKSIKASNKTILSIGKYFTPTYKEKLKNYIKQNLQNINIIKDNDDIIPYIHKAEFVVTSYGITALESMFLGKNTALYNHSSYHTKLSKIHSNLFYLGTYPWSSGSAILRNLKIFLKTKNKLKTKNLKNHNKNIITIFKHIKNLKNISENRLCKSCKSRRTELISNKIETQIYNCKNCKSKFLNKTVYAKTSQRYKDAYFNEEYKEQYGKTYIDDKENISKLSISRLQVISKSLNNNTKNKKILDIGCAYGFFLEQAKTFKFKPYGMEIEKNAVKYVRSKLKINTVKANFLEYKFKETFDVISMWYVLEHFSNPEEVMKKISSIINDNGLIAVSIPNGNGPFVKYNRKAWIECHPDDHFFDYSLKGIKTLFKRYGFKLASKRITGFHPERYISYPKILLPLLRLFKTGDTIELYFKWHRPFR